MTAVASSVVAPHPTGVAALDGTAGTTAEPTDRTAHTDDRVDPVAGGTPGPAEPSLPIEARASLALLRHIGGEGYVGPSDDMARNTIAQASAAALHARGLITIRYRRTGDVVTLTERDAS